jgi:uncharacterized protein (DUF302 family)
MIEHHTRYGMSVTVPLPYDQAVGRIRTALAKEGFGILTEIDVRSTFKQKLDAEFRPYVILGACNPPMAHKALTAEKDIGLLLPCNVVVYAGDDPATSVVAAIDPVEALSLSGNAGIHPLALEVRSKLERALEDVASA